MSTTIKIWLDNERPIRSPYNFHAKTANEAIERIRQGDVSSISLDHDLGDGNGTGYDVAKFIEEGAINGTVKRMTLAVHTPNPAGRVNICAALRNAVKSWIEREQDVFKSAYE